MELGGAGRTKMFWAANGNRYTLTVYSQKCDGKGQV